MSRIEHQSLVQQVLLAMGARDPESSRVGREGLHPNTARHVAQIVLGPAAARVLSPLARPDLTEDHLVNALRVLSSGTAIPELDFPAYVVSLREVATRDAQAAAWGGLLGLAVLEGLTRRHRPDSEYPYFGLTSIAQVVMPVAELLCAADLLGGAAMLCGLQRGYLLADAYQRGDPRGQHLILRCRDVERRYAGELRVAGQETAWLLRDSLRSDVATRLWLVGVLVAIGEPIRARAVAARRHEPSIAVLRDITEASLDLAPEDPLLQAVWLRCPIDLPERVGLPIRTRRPDLNVEFKSWDKAVATKHGIHLSAAYAELLLGYVSGLWHAEDHAPAAWAAIGELVELPIIWEHYRNGVTRIAELLTLAGEPGADVPMSDHIAARTGYPIDQHDVRTVATASLLLDTETARRGQYGRSLAYDSSFQVEPARREETAEQALERLEGHRAAGLISWLRATPPFTPVPSGTKQKKIVERDCALTAQYLNLTGRAVLADAAVHHRTYGDEAHRRLLGLDESAWNAQFNAWIRDHAIWLSDAERDFPAYWELREQRGWSVGAVQEFIRRSGPL